MDKNTKFIVAMEYNDKHVFTKVAILTGNGVERLTREQVFSQFKSGIRFCSVLLMFRIVFPIHDFILVLVFSSFRFVIFSCKSSVIPSRPFWLT